MSFARFDPKNNLKKQDEILENESKRLFFVSACFLRIEVQRDLNIQTKT